MLHAEGDTVRMPVARFNYTVVDTTETCEVRVTFRNESYVRIMVGVDSLDSIGTTTCNDIFWHIDGMLSGAQEVTHLFGLGEHFISLIAGYGGSYDTITMPFLVTDFCHCYDTIRDTVVENQLPWTVFESHTFSHDIDTTFFFPSAGHPVCDTVIDYHLKVWWNHHDTITYYNCKGAGPVEYDSLLIYGDTVMSLSRQGIHGEDSTIFFTLSLVPGTDTTIYDTIREEQLPWFFMDSLFFDSVDDQVFVIYNSDGCDSTIHYHLHVFWNYDHCDTTLSFGNVVTPNGDGINDRFIIGGLLSNNCYKYNELTIFDRTGHVVYHRKNIARDDEWWDPGTDRIPSGTYFYIFKAHGVVIQTQHNGVIEVLREK